MTDNDTRRKLLLKLIRGEAAPRLMAEELAQFGWDCEVELVDLSPQDLRSIIARFVRGEITSDGLEEWANTVEGRDDIDFVGARVKDVLAEIANPQVFGNITVSRAEEWLSALQDSA